MYMIWYMIGDTGFQKKDYHYF